MHYRTVCFSNVADNARTTDDNAGGDTTDATNLRDLNQDIPTEVSDRVMVLYL